MTPAPSADLSAARHGGQRDPDGETAARACPWPRSARPWPRRSPWRPPGRARRRVALADARERLEDPLLLLVGTPLAVVHHVEQHPVVDQLGAQLGRPRGRRVPQRVGEQVGQHPLEQAGVGEHQRQAVGHRHLAAAAASSSPRSATGATSSIAGRAQERLQRPGVQAAHVEQVADQRVEPVGVLLDGGQQLGLVVLGPFHVGLPQAADAGLDRGQRRAQVVADRARAGRSASGCPRPAPRPGRPGCAAGPGRARRQPGRRSRPAGRAWPIRPAR